MNTKQIFDSKKLFKFSKLKVFYQKNSTLMYFGMKLKFPLKMNLENHHQSGPKSHKSLLPLFIAMLPILYFAFSYENKMYLEAAKSSETKNSYLFNLKEAMINLPALDRRTDVALLINYGLI